MPNGQSLIGADRGLFRHGGKQIVPVSGNSALSHPIHLFLGLA